jgi:hypothetical protein
MNKYGEITTTGGSGLISLNNVILARLFGGNFILINYANGSLCSIQATTAFTQADAEVIFDVIKNAQEQKWDTVKYTVPTLSDSVASISFTF